MSNAPLRILGSVKVELLITRRNERPRKILGSASSSNVRDNLNDLRYKAIQDAIAQYQHISGGIIDDSDTLRRQTTDGTYQYNIIRSWVDYSYSKKFYKVKRVVRKGKYYAEARDIKTGKVKSRSKWSSKNPLW